MAFMRGIQFVHINLKANPSGISTANFLAKLLQFGEGCDLVLTEGFALQRTLQLVCKKITTVVKTSSKQFNS
jgi:hypothetical protein